MVHPVPVRCTWLYLASDGNAGDLSGLEFEVASVPGPSLSVRQPARTRGRIIRTSSIRGRGGAGGSGAAAGSVVMSSTRPAPYVPEDLVAQAQSVLQGRSRNLIIRELQRTNLDVNLAVNNLLSRDEEDGDDGGGEEGQVGNSIDILGTFKRPFLGDLFSFQYGHSSSSCI